MIVEEVTETAVFGSFDKPFKRGVIIHPIEIGQLVQASSKEGSEFLTELAEIHEDEGLFRS